MGLFFRLRPNHATSKIEEGKGQEEGGLSAPGSEESRAQKGSEPTV